MKREAVFKAMERKILKDAHRQNSREEESDGDRSFGF
jgi:hypothetical protein